MRLLPMGKYVEQPIRIEMREGSIVSIDGGADARLLKDFFEQPKDKRALTVSPTSGGGTNTGPIGTPSGFVSGKAGE